MSILNKKDHTQPKSSLDILSLVRWGRVLSSPLKRGVARSDGVCRVIASPTARNDNHTGDIARNEMTNAFYRHSRENGNPGGSKLDSCSSVPSKKSTGRNDRTTGFTPLEKNSGSCGTQLSIEQDEKGKAFRAHSLLNHNSLTGFTPLKTTALNHHVNTTGDTIGHRVYGSRATAKFLTGFTLIELMVVVVIIGILAAIAIPNYIAMKNRANQASVEAAIHTIQLTLENYAVDTGGVYPSTPNLSDQNFVNLLPNKQMPQNPYTFVSMQPTSASGYQPDPSSWALIHSGCSGTATAGQITYYFSPSTAPTAWSMNGCNSSGAITVSPTYENFVVHN